jgi:cell division GTPase FtsZ
MKLVVVGTGQGGSNIADEFVALSKWVWKNRRIRIFTGGRNDPLSTGVFAINLGAADLYGLQHIPQTDNHTILLGTTDEFRGRGAGKVNADGAEQARRGEKKIMTTVRDYGDVYSADAILVCATTAGGTGSGSVGVIVDLLKDAFKKPVWALLVLPFENQYDDPDSMVNTATCLKRVLHNSKADAVFLVDNQKFVRKGAEVGVNLSQINRRIADSFVDLLCVGEETERRYIGEVLDANDVIRIVQGPCAIGVSQTDVPKKPSFLSGIFKNGAGSNHFSQSKARVERAQNVVHQALAELSIDCEVERNGQTYYDAANVLGLFSGPAREATEEIIEMMDNCFADRVPGAGRRKGTYPGRTSDTIAVTTIVTNLGEGAAMEKVEWFTERATHMLVSVKEKRESREKAWEVATRLSDNVPLL